MSTSTGAGLNALTQAVSDLTTAVNTNTADSIAATAEITSLLSQLSNSEDPQVQALATQIEAQVAVINTANSNLQSAVPAPSGTATASVKKAV